MNSNKYVMLFLILIGIVFWGNVALWYGFSKDYFTDADGHGDLTRLATMPHVKAQTPNILYDRLHVEFAEYLQMEDKPIVDVLTFGDSFSNGVGGTYYQDYLADRYNKSVLNVPKIGSANPVVVLRDFIESGVIDEIKPQVVVLGSAEKYAVERLDGRDKTVKSMTREKLIKTYNGYRAEGNKDIVGLLPGIMPKYNLQVIEGVVRQKDNGNKLSNNVYKEKLKENLFTNKEREDMLLFSDEDLWGQKFDIDFEPIHQNLNEIAMALKERGIQLVVMINVDKMDLYQPYIVATDQYKENIFMDMFAQNDGDYVFINTRDILREMLAEGEKDVYWQDDTHWSWKAQQRVVDVLMTKVKFRER
ncbi:SGNH hydrolase-like domain-containing protein, acetyltransferase AlgX [Selenomonas sp. GACV-9]|uniref:alginate O-acetyltransferase AlgX-related protein n=1 Tax=Selenomonas sp. GACV-9 TaxID=3158782 RepID=UPI0008EE343A|nr:SGNH hydrolase-like domain-containing protein, acetyltransferase AlgX [Selenomonas ruminantium]